MIATRLCNEFSSQDRHGIRAKEETLNKSPPRREGGFNLKMIIYLMKTEFQLWLVMNLIRQRGSSASGRLLLQNFQP